MISTALENTCVRELSSASSAAGLSAVKVFQIEAEIAARALHGVFPLAVALDYALDALGGDAVGVVHHLNEDKLAAPAVRLVHVEDSMGGGAGTGKRVEDERIWRCCDC